MRARERTTTASIGARIVRRLAATARGVAVADVRIGLGYTAVMLADGRAGVAYTFRDEVPAGCSVLAGTRPLAGRRGADLLALLESTDPIEAGVGLACANALANRETPEQLAGDMLDHVAVRADDDIAMVGHFGPLVEPLRRRARSLTIFERVTAPTGPLRPQAEAGAALGRCQIAVLTATSIINHTLDGLLEEAAGGCREVVLLGASTPLVADVFAATGVTMLSGVVVRAADEVLRVVSEGGGMRQFSSHVRKVSMRVSALAPPRERFAR